MSVPTNTILTGDCLEIMKTLPDNSIDAIVSDPPYGLKFMGKEWDHGIPGKHYWEEVLRVAKPGAHLLAFGGTRTYHRLTCAIEDAGWEIRDCLMWVYGCISEDTEILTTNGWERYHRNIINSHALTYNIETGEFSFDKPSRVFFYQNKHPAYNIRSDHSDQIVSRNHRCIVERNGREAFCYAETLECKEIVPVLESLYDLPESIPDIYERTSVTKQDLLNRVHQKEIVCCKNGETETIRTKEAHKNNLSGLWETDMETGGMGKKGRSPNMQSKMQWDTPGGRVESICSHGAGWMVRRCGGKVKDTYDWLLKSCVERRSNLLQNARELYRSKICTVPRKIQRYGTEGWICDGAPVNYGSTSGEMFETNRSNSSYRSRSLKQQDRKPDDIQIKSRAQGVRRERATVTEIEYTGNVWCISVASGAFVARRNGKIFITGNSGFPKSLDVSKAIDKAAGVEREKIINPLAKKQTASIKTVVYGDYNAVEFISLNAATEAAKQWSGWGTALKPAWEPVIMARKPIEGTVANNVLTYGTGGINIDGCRIDTNGEKMDRAGYMDDIRGGQYAKGKVKHNLDAGYMIRKYGGDQGRFPANLILDETAAIMLDEQSGVLKSGKLSPENNVKESSGWSGGSYSNRVKNTFERNSGGASRFFYCAKASPSERGEGNNHPTVKPLSLMKYLCKLITPPGGLVLDPFSGSGSTLIAAKQEGFNYLGIELNPEYVEIANARLSKECSSNLTDFISLSEPTEV